MNLITIDKKFFKLDSNISKGLISGLKETATEWISDPG